MEDEQQQILQAIQSGALTGDLMSQTMQAIYHIQDHDMWDDELPPMDAVNQAIEEAEKEGMWVNELPPMEAIDAAMEHVSRQL